jgi:t-SNARE complex subunit (syntaxin)
MIVHENGLLIDSIENKINNAKDYAEKGLGNMTEAKEHHVMAKKKKWWVCGCI